MANWGVEMLKLLQKKSEIPPENEIVLQNCLVDSMLHKVSIPISKALLSCPISTLSYCLYHLAVNVSTMHPLSQRLDDDICSKSRQVSRMTQSLSLQQPTKPGVLDVDGMKTQVSLATEQAYPAPIVGISNSC
jgi:hypothetical protein